MDGSLKMKHHFIPMQEVRPVCPVSPISDSGDEYDRDGFDDDDDESPNGGAYGYTHQYQSKKEKLCEIALPSLDESLLQYGTPGLRKNRSPTNLHDSSPPRLPQRALAPPSDFVLQVSSEHSPKKPNHQDHCGEDGDDASPERRLGAKNRMRTRSEELHPHFIPKGSLRRHRRSDVNSSSHTATNDKCPRATFSRESSVRSMASSGEPSVRAPPPRISRGDSVHLLQSLARAASERHLETDDSDDPNRIPRLSRHLLHGQAPGPSLLGDDDDDLLDEHAVVPSLAVCMKSGHGDGEEDFVPKPPMRTNSRDGVTGHSSKCPSRAASDFDESVSSFG